MLTTRRTIVDVVDGERNASAASVFVGIAGKFTQCRRNPRLVLRLESDEFRDLARALARKHDIVLVRDIHG